MAVKHPTTGKPALTWEMNASGVHVATTEQMAKYRRGQAYVVREAFATIRPAFNTSAMLDSSCGYVVLRNSFDEIREFGDIDTAKVYVESLFALEHGAE